MKLYFAGTVTSDTVTLHETSSRKIPADLQFFMLNIQNRRLHSRTGLFHDTMSTGNVIPYNAELQTHPGSQAVTATIFCTVAPSICGSSA